MLDALLVVRGIDGVRKNVSLVEAGTSSPQH